METMASDGTALSDVGSSVLVRDAGVWMKMGGVVLVGLLTLAVMEQLYFLRVRKTQSGKSLPGPVIAMPFIGSILNMTADPFGFWNAQRDYAPSGISWNSIVGYFSVLVTEPEAVRTILNNNGDDSFKMILHPNGHKLLGDANIAFINGPKHKALRKSFVSLFTRKALSVYLKIQQECIRDTLKKMIASNGAEFELRPFVRDLNLRTSQYVFVGKYIRDQEQFSKDYLELTLGFLCLPILFPGSQLYKSIQARKRVTVELAHCAKLSKARMEAGEEPECLMDFWAQRVLEEIDECDRSGAPYAHYASDDGMGHVMLDFLFASQDASTASLAWVTVLMADHPEILAKVREEQQAVRPNNEPLTFDLMEKLVYTRAVILETLRFRPPAVFVPQIAMADYQLTPDYVVPKGSMVFPSLIEVCHQDFPEPHTFLPERMMPERQEHITHRANFLPFGQGPHYCVGREYAVNHLIAFLSMLSTECDWTRRRTDKSDMYEYLPTIYPGDSLVRLHARQPASAA
ncbi:Cytochrome P450 [Porphyridium purpureum]|uniref:sterol 22-desaturase n=1 Tax=Porphyridium purpureum TaxID=35688 RepID=A0A5J4YWA9_PORPP|nr:Cytochrome P450 [Porphyridium purpureum]|eukprot:POR9810..scf227_4